MITDLGTLGGSFVASVALDINDRGQVVGASSTAAHVARAFVWQNGTMTQLGTLGGPNSAADLINNRGQIVGTADTRRKNNYGDMVSDGFLWQNGKMIDLGRVEPRSINDRGQIVGGIVIATDWEHAFLWQDGKIRDLGTLGGLSSIAGTINERGQVVGDADLPRGENNAWRYHPFLWQNGHMRDLGSLGGSYTGNGSAFDINEGGQVVGNTYSTTISYGDLGPGVHAFLWQDGRMRDLGNLDVAPPTSGAIAINDRGEIIGSSGNRHAFLSRKGRMIDIGPLGGVTTQAIAINNQGRVAGSTVTVGPRSVTHAFVWENGRMTDLGTLGGNESEAFAINDRGEIVGQATTRNGQTHAVLWTLKTG